MYPYDCAYVDQYAVRGRGTVRITLLEQESMTDCAYVDQYAVRGRGTVRITLLEQESMIPLEFKSEALQPDQSSSFGTLYQLIVKPFCPYFLCIKLGLFALRDQRDRI